LASQGSDKGEEVLEPVTDLCSDNVLLSPLIPLIGYVLEDNKDRVAGVIGVGEPPSTDQHGTPSNIRKVMNDFVVQDRSRLGDDLSKELLEIGVAPLSVAELKEAFADRFVPGDLESTEKSRVRSDYAQVLIEYDEGQLVSDISGYETDLLT